MYENILAWAGLVLLLILCLPFAGLQRTLLAVYGLAFRLVMIALVAGAAYLWFRPAELPSQVADVVRNTPLLARILPEPGVPIFAVCAASLVAVVLLPLIALIDVSRHSRIREKVIVNQTVPVPTPVVTQETVLTAPYATPTVRSRFGRRDAAATMTHVGTTR